MYVWVCVRRGFVCVCAVAMAGDRAMPPRRQWPCVPATKGLWGRPELAVRLGVSVRRGRLLVRHPRPCVRAPACASVRTGTTACEAARVWEPAAAEMHTRAARDARMCAYMHACRAYNMCTAYIHAYMHTYIHTYIHTHRAPSEGYDGRSRRLDGPRSQCCTGTLERRESARYSRWKEGASALNSQHVPSIVSASESRCTGVYDTRDGRGSASALNRSSLK